jgi:hypothetical protein
MKAGTICGAFSFQKINTIFKGKESLDNGYLDNLDNDSSISL